MCLSSLLPAIIIAPLIVQKNKTGNNCSWRPTHKTLGVELQLDLKFQTHNPKLKTKGHPSFISVIRLRKAFRKVKLLLFWRSLWLCILYKMWRLWIALECAHPQHAGDHSSKNILEKKHILRSTGEESPVYLECNAVVVGCCVCGQTESHFLVFIQNEAGHSFSFVKKLSVWEGSEHVYPVGSEPGQCRLLLLVLALLIFPSSCALRWADRKSCQSGCQSFKGPIERAHKGSFVQHLDGGDASSFQAENWGFVFTWLLLATSGLMLKSFQPVSSPKWGWLQSEVPFALHLPPF